MADSSKTPTSTGERLPSILAEAAKAPFFPKPAPQFSFGRLSNNDIYSKAQTSTTERPKPVLHEARKPSSSSTTHQSSPQQFRFGPYSAHPPLQTRDRRDSAEGKVESQAARIKALEFGFEALTERYQKASGLVEKYEVLLKTVEKEYADKLKSSEGNNKLVLEKVADNYIARIKALEDEKKTLQELKEMPVKDSMEWPKKYLILQETNEEHLTKISSLNKIKDDLKQELESSLATIESLEKKNESLTAMDQERRELADTMEEDNEELLAKNSVLHKQNEEFLMAISVLEKTQFRLEQELMGSFAILESLETENGLNGEKKDESAVNLIESSEKKDQVLVDDGSKEDEQVKRLEVILSAIVESSARKEEFKCLRVLLFIITICIILFALWTISEARWSWDLGIDIENAIFLLRVWISDLEDRFFG